VRARNAARTIRQSVRRILDESPGPQLTTTLLARIANANAETQDALEEIERIAEKEKTK
jgi:hypothetical protein